MQNETLNEEFLSHMIFKDKLEKWIKVQDIIAKDTVLQNHVQEYGYSRKKLYEIYCKKAYRLHKLINYSDEVIPGMVNSQFPETIVTVLHQTMFIPTIKNLGTEKQIERWIPKCVNYEVIGCYAQTELGHGSDVQNLETIAIYDKQTEEFILNSPTISSSKWWIGDLGFTANHAATHAQLYIDGKHYGVQTFIVQVRDVDTHQPMKGIEVGDVGAKYGYNTKDNGFMRMKDVRVPRENMLMRYSKVTKAGEFIKSQNEKIGYATMMQVRLSIICNTYVSLAQGLAIAVRYSNSRTQFKGKDQIERPIIDYQTQQDKITPLMATCYAHMLGYHKISDILTENLRRVNEKMDFSLMGDLHALLCCCKAVYTWACHFGLDKLRQSLGGHGFLLSSGIATIQTEFAPSCTYEGENTVLLLQTARYLIKALNKSMKKQHINENVEYLNDIQVTLESKATFQSVDQIMYPEVLRKILRFNAAFLVNRAFTQMMEMGAQHGPKDAWNKHCGIALTEAAIAHTHYFTFKTFMDSIFSINDETLREAITQLCCLYGVQKIIEYPNGLFMGGYLNGEQLQLIEEGRQELISALKPHLGSLANAYRFHDNALRSDLISKDPYQKLLESAKKSNVNEEGFQEKLREILIQIQGKQHPNL